MARKPLPSSTKRGYGQEHRRKVAREREQQWGRPCCRCGWPMERGQDIQLDHRDDRQGYLGWSHRSCNVRASNRRRAALRRAQGFTPRRVRPTRAQPAQDEIEPGVWVFYQVPPRRQHTRGW